MDALGCEKREPNRRTPKTYPSFIEFYIFSIQDKNVAYNLKAKPTGSNLTKYIGGLKD